LKDKILITEKIADSGIESLKKEFDVDVKLDLAKDKPKIVEVIGDYNALIIRSATKVDKDILDAAKNMKIIGRAGIGVDNVDVEEATKHGIIVANAPQSNIISAAEHAMALMLALSRNIAKADKSLREGKWERSKFEGAELYEKTLGVIGLGKIGMLVAERSAGFGMNLIAYDPYLSSEKARQLGIKLVDKLDDLLKEADFITVHLPKNKETLGLIGEKEIAKMKSTARIINTARGGIIDEKALAKAIDEGKIAGAGFDVYETEPCTDSPLFSVENAVVTPHLGASTEEAQDKAGITIAEQVMAGLKGEFVSFAVNLSASVDEAIKPYLPLAENAGSLFANLIEKSIDKIEVEYFGEIATHNTGLLTVAVLKGIFGKVVHEPVTYVNAPLIAKERGIEVIESKSETPKEYLNLIRVVTVQNGETVSAAVTMVENQERFVEINGYAVDLPPQNYMAYFKYQDVPGVIGKVGTVLGKAGINIASMQVGRQKYHGQAAMVITVDSPISDDLIDEIKVEANISEAKAITIK
jgi:D-3-phosphoglycerate dehydrogenase